MDKRPATKAACALDAVAECLRICDMFADENMEMATDTLMHPLRLLPYRKEGARPLTAKELALFEKLNLLGLSHSSKAHAAKAIATAIREHFGLQSDTNDGGIVPPEKCGE